MAFLSGPSNRPSSLHGLKHKLHVKTKTLHSPSRRKSVGHIPLSPLARTPSPSPIPISPTRSPSPLAALIPGVAQGTAHHVPGSSNTTQTYSPGSSLTPSVVQCPTRYVVYYDLTRLFWTFRKKIKADQKKISNFFKNSRICRLIFFSIRSALVKKFRRYCSKTFSLNSTKFSKKTSGNYKKY